MNVKLNQQFATLPVLQARYLLMAVVLVPIFLLATGCGSTSRSNIKPGYDNLSGIYTFEGLGGYAASQFPNPLVNFDDITEPTDITIVQTDGFIQASYLSSSGATVMNVIDLNDPGNSGATWRESTLTSSGRVPVTGAPILPLPARHYRGTRILRGEDGNLYFIGTFEERGLGFTDYWENELLLVRRDDV